MSDTRRSGGKVQDLGVQEQVHRLFLLGLSLKVINSGLEVVGGTVLAFVSTSDVLRITNAVTQHELLRDPNDLGANFLLNWAAQLTGGNLHGAALFLLSHGVIKLALVIGVLLGVRGAYPAFMVALAFLIAYQSYRLSHGFSFALMALTILDGIVLFLAWHEYSARRVKAQE